MRVAAMLSGAAMLALAVPCSAQDTHPPASIEDMYRPERFGRTGFGTVEVTSARS